MDATHRRQHARSDQRRAAVRIARRNRVSSGGGCHRRRRHGRGLCRVREYIASAGGDRPCGGLAGFRLYRRLDRRTDAARLATKGTGDVGAASTERTLAAGLLLAVLVGVVHMGVGNGGALCGGQSLSRHLCPLPPQARPHRTGDQLGLVGRRRHGQHRRTDLLRRDRPQDYAASRRTERDGAFLGNPSGAGDGCPRRLEPL